MQMEYLLVTQTRLGGCFQGDQAGRPVGEALAFLSVSLLDRQVEIDEQYRMAEENLFLVETFLPGR